MTKFGRNPEVEFTYEGEEYVGREVGISMPREGDGETRSIIKCEELDEEAVRVSQSDVTFL
jgi:hypothetical protein